MDKKVGPMDHYEILNLRVDAGEEEIRKAYELAVATYHPDALAAYGVLSADERREMLVRVEKAYATLKSPEERKAYDEAILPGRPESGQRAIFRKSTEKLEIEDAPEKRSLRDRLKSLFLPRKPGKKRPEPTNGDDRKDRRALRQSPTLYGDYLKQVREDRGLTIQDVAQISGLDMGVLRLLEAGETALLPEGEDADGLIRRYARYLGVDAENDN